MVAKTGEQPRLQDDAATAALYVTKPKPGSKQSILDENGKLSSASAATSLKYAKATDLPSFPVSGLKLSSAGAAATLANSNHKDFQRWKPGTIPAAEKAAYLAKDYQADPLWHPEMSQAGSKAALLAARDGGNVDIWLPSASEAGQSAADLAVRNKGLSPVMDRSVPADASRRAMLAATGAMSSGRRRAESAPLKPDHDADAASAWALKAATASHRGTPSSAPYQYQDPANNASRIQNMAKTNMSREMYTSNPPVAIEVEERNRQDTLRASAVAMARKIYAVQQKAIDEAKVAEGLSRTDSHRAANHSHHRKASAASSIGSEDSSPTHPQYTNLQEAAMKLAQERLAKLRPDENQTYRDYYGASTAPPRSRLSMRGTLRRRASSDGQLDRVDEEESKKIRSQMSLFRSKIDDIDKSKQQKDRDALMAAAQRNVTASMSTMDEKVFNESGKPTKAMMDEWEKKAREHAQANSDVRMENYGKVHIGGGKYVDQSEVDAVARARLQPTLDDLSEKAEQHRARDEEIRLDQEEKKRELERDRAREAEVKAETKRNKDQEKQAERTRKDEEKRLAKEEKRKSRDTKGRSLGAILGLGGAGATTGAAEAVEDEKVAVEAPTLDPIPTTEPIVTPGASTNVEAKPVTAVVADDDDDDADTISTVASPEEQEEEAGAKKEPADEVPPVTAAVTDEDEQPTAPASPTKKSWFSRFRRSSKPVPPTKETEVTDDNTASAPKESISSPSEDGPAETSMRDVAMVGRTKTQESEDMYAASDSRPAAGSPSISSMASSDIERAEDDNSPERGRSRAGLKPPLKQRLLNIVHTKDSNDDNDEFEEARDTFEEAGAESGDKGLRDSTYMEVTKDPGSDVGSVTKAPSSGSKFSEIL